MTIFEIHKVWDYNSKTYKADIVIVESGVEVPYLHNIDYEKAVVVCDALNYYVPNYKVKSENP